MQTVWHSFPKRIIPIKDAPSGLKDRVEETVTGGPVPKGVKPWAEPDLITPVDDLPAFLLQLFLGIFVKKFVVELLLRVSGEIFDFWKKKKKQPEYIIILILNVKM